MKRGAVTIGIRNTGPVYQLQRWKGVYTFALTGASIDHKLYRRWRLPPGFIVDRQQNRGQPANLAYYVNAARTLGDMPVAHAGEIIREALLPVEGRGFCVQPCPTEGFVHLLAGANACIA